MPSTLPTLVEGLWNNNQCHNENDNKEKRIHDTHRDLNKAQGENNQKYKKEYYQGNGNALRVPLHVTRKDVFYYIKVSKQD